MPALEAKPPLLGRALLRLCRLGDRRADVVADMQELFDTRVCSAGLREASRRFNADAMSLLLPSRRSLTSGLRADVRDAFRALGRTPLQSASLFLCLLLGTALTVVMFTVVNTIFAGELPGIADRGSLVRLSIFRLTQTGQVSTDRSSLNIGRIQALPPVLPGVAGTAFQLSASATTASINREPTRVRTQIINGAYFSVLGTKPAAGRLIQPADDQPGSAPAVVIGYDLWQRVFGGAVTAIGTSVAMGPTQYEIVGIAPRGFGGISNVQAYSLGGGASDVADVWLPQAHALWGKDALVLTACGGCAGGKVVFRLQNGASIRDVEPHLARLTEQINAANAEQIAKNPFRRFGGFALEPFRLTEEGTDTAELFGGVALLMTVPFLVLAIACINVAGVQLSRTLRRTPELATRVALGATRVQLARLISLESAVLAFGAGLSAWFLTAQALRWTEGLLPVAVTADERVFVFALVTPLAVTFLAGLLPSWRATGFQVLVGLQQGAGSGSSTGVTRVRRVVLVVQIAVSVALLGTALHLARGVRAAPAVLAPPQSDVLMASARLFELDFTTEQRASIRAELERDLRALPGVSEVGFGDSLFTQTNWGDGPTGAARQVTPGWFAAIGHRLLSGRLPGSHEPDAVVINATLAARHGGVDAAIGKRVDMQSFAGGKASRSQSTVVGVVEDGYERVAWGHRVSVGYMVVPAGTLSDGLNTVFVKGPGAAAAEPRIRALLAAVHPQLAPYEIGTIESLVNKQYQATHVAVTVLVVMSVSALLLAAVGLFGAISQSAGARVREFGVRLALGARPVDIGRIVLVETAWVSGLGLTVGLLVATLAAAFVRANMIETASPSALMPALVVVLAVSLIALLAALTPARRVMAIDPVRSLRAD